LSPPELLVAIIENLCAGLTRREWEMPNCASPETG
jgi:hypothetical protein